MEANILITQIFLITISQIHLQLPLLTMITDLSILTNTTLPSPVQLLLINQHQPTYPDTSPALHDMFFLDAISIVDK